MPTYCDLTIIDFVVFAIAIEAIAEIITTSDLFAGPRKGLRGWVYPEDQPPPDNLAQHFKVLLDKLATCGYCQSVWLAAFFFVLPTVTSRSIAVVFALHRLSNFWHNAFEFARRGRVRTYDILLKHEQPAPSQDEQEI